MKLHDKLSKLLDWPIPYWITPIGLLVLVGIWQGFNWKLNTENWPFWVWALDKAITAGIILGSALYAQRVFNGNAIRREDTDRRLKAAIELTSEINKYLEKCIPKQYDVNTLKSLSNMLLDAESHIEAVLKMHDFKIKTKTSELKIARTSLSKIIQDVEYLSNSGLALRTMPALHDSFHKALNLEARETFKSIRSDIAKLAHELRKHQLSRSK